MRSYRESSSFGGSGPSQGAQGDGPGTASTTSSNTEQSVGADRYQHYPIPLSDHNTSRPSPSFLHRLPPPFPSSSSPRNYLPSSPRDTVSPSGSMTDPQSWAHKLSGSGSRQRWSPPSFPGASPRLGEGSINSNSDNNRLPPLADFPHRTATAAIWDQTPPALSYPIINTRHEGSSYPLAPYRPNTSYHPQPTNLTPISSNDNEDDDNLPSTGARDDRVEHSPRPTTSEKQKGSESETPQKKKKRRVALSW